MQREEASQTLKLALKAIEGAPQVSDSDAEAWAELVELVLFKGMMPASRIDSILARFRELPTLPLDPFATRVHGVAQPSAPETENDPFETKSLPSASNPGPNPPARTGESWAEWGTATTRYRIVRPHAKGALGQVSIAIDAELNREVALKEIQELHADDPSSRARFVLEAEVTGRLEHPGIVPVYGLGSDLSGRPYYAMRFVRGETLKDAIERFQGNPGQTSGERAVGLRKLVRRFLDVCDAIDYAHARGIVHRDLKPANILLGPHGETLVVDWGLAKVIGDPKSPAASELEEGPFMRLSGSGSAETMAGSVVGTPAFMSPEQAEGRLDAIGPASDVYSLGATLYAIFTGRAPFFGADLIEILSRARRGEFPPPRTVQRDVPRAVEAILLKAMALKASDRYSSARALADDLENWMADEPVSAWNEPWIVRAARWARRHKTTVAVAGAILLATTVAVSVSAVLVGQQRDRAERNLTESRRVVSSMFDEIVPKLSDVKGMDSVEMEILKSALKFHEEFVRPQSSDPDVVIDAAHANDQVGGILKKLGRDSESQKSLAKAIELLEPLALGDGPNLDAVTVLADTYLDMAMLQDNLSRDREAEKFYLKTLALNEKLVAAFPSVPRRLSALAWSHHNLCVCYYDQKRLAEAEAECDKAIAIRRDLVARFPDEVDFLRGLTRSFNMRGNLLESARRFSEAEATHNEARAIREKLVKRFPTSTMYQNELAMTYNNLANLAWQADRLDEAVTLTRKALAIRQTLADDHPEVDEHQEDLLSILSNLGMLESSRDHDDEAEACLARAHAIAARRVEGQPKVDRFRGRLADICFRLAEMQSRPGHSADAEKTYQEACDLLEPLVRSNPENLAYRGDLVGSLGNLGLLLEEREDHTGALARFDTALQIAGQIGKDQTPTRMIRRNTLVIREGRARTLDKLKRYPESLEEWNRVVKISPDEDQPDQRMSRAYAFARLGQREKAISEVDSLTAAAAKPDAERFYNAASVISLVCAVTSKDSSLGPLGDRAMTLLRKALELGYFQDRDAQKAFFQDQDLDSLRTRADFEGFSREAGFPDLPFATAGGRPG